MAGINKAILIGHLGQDPELRHTPDGKAVCNFSVATSEKWTDRSTGELHENTEWHNIVAWERTAETCAQYLTKGSQVYVEGSLQTRDWEDREGNKRKTTEIKARTVQFLGGKGGGGEESRDQSSSYSDEDTNQVDHNPASPGYTDDVPF